MNIAELYQIYLQHSIVQTDTRKLTDGCLFFALKGPNFNANTFAAQALSNGAAYAVVDEAEYATNDKCILVDDVLQTLQQLAKHHREQLNIPFLAITGSNGKTTTKELVNTVLKKKFKTYATVGNLNNHIGVPLTILSIKNDAEFAIIEMGANHLHEIEGYCKIALPTHAIITNCGKAHIEGFGGIEGVRKGKGELYDHIRTNNGIIFRNADLPYLKDMAVGIAQQITYGSADANYIGKPIMNGILLDVAVLNRLSEALVKTNLVGNYNFANVMAAIAVGLHFGIDISDIKDAIAAYDPDNSRSQWLVKGTNKLILDAYNANPTSMHAAIVNFANSNLSNKTLWLGAMKEMGTEETNEHKALVALIDEYTWEEVILVGKEFAGLNGQHKLFDTSAEAAAYIKNNKPENASILIKGSRGSKMEVMAEVL